MSAKTPRSRLAASMLLLVVFPCCGGDKPVVEPEPLRPTTITVSPESVTFTFIRETTRFTATVRDQNGNTINLTVAWSTSDASVFTVDGNGTATAVSNGAGTSQATAGGVTGTASVAVAQSPAELEIVSGNNQNGLFGQMLPEPLVVRVEDQGGTGVAGVTVTFAPGEESGSVSAGTVDTDADGQASTEWTLGDEPTQLMTVSAPGKLRHEFTAEAVSGLYECGSGAAALRMNALDLPLRAIHASGNWGTNEQVVEEWMKAEAGPLVPADHIAWLKSLHVNWVGISVALSFDDSMDSTLEPVYSVDGGTFSDAALRQFIRDFRAQGIDVYMTLAIDDHRAAEASRPAKRWQLGYPGDAGGDPRILTENWPWYPDHPDHDRFVAEFWETYTEHAVHFARLAGDEGARLFSLGTETDRLFRTRPWGDHMVNDFRDELQSMVDRVRTVYDGLLTYDMHYDVLQTPDFYGPGSHCLWDDLSLDVVGISAWFGLVDSPPSSVMSVTALETPYDRIFRDYLVPLANRNTGRPIVFLEYGAMDVVATPFRPDDTSDQGMPFVYADANGNRVDDGRETQANVYQALVNTMELYPGVLDGFFLWDNWMASDELWADWWANRRNFDIRGKPAGEVVRAAYESWRR